MKPNMKIKFAVDVAMTALFLMQMGYHMLDNRAHEWTGVTLCLNIVFTLAPPKRGQALFF